MRQFVYHDRHEEQQSGEDRRRPDHAIRPGVIRVMKDAAERQGDEHRDDQPAIVEADRDAEDPAEGELGLHQPFFTPSISVGPAYIRRIGGLDYFGNGMPGPLAPSPSDPAWPSRGRRPSFSLPRFLLCSERDGGAVSGLMAISAPGFFAGGTMARVSRVGPGST